MSDTALSPLLSAPPEIRARVAWREVILFCLLAYGLSWAWDGIWVIPRLGTLLSSATTPADPTLVFGSMLAHLPAMFGPMLAAAVMRLRVPRKGFRGSLGLRRPFWHYAIAAGGALVFPLAVAVVALATGAARPDVLPADQITAILVPMLVVTLLLEIVLGFGEEYGWRGYLLPELMPLGEVRATLLLGIVWALWHVPVVLAGVLLGGQPTALVLAVHVALVTLGAFPYTWLGRLTGHSPSVAAVFHGTLNWAQNRLFGLLVLGNLLVFVAFIGAGWLVLILAVYGFRRLRHDRMREGNPPATRDG
jgi:membrane protease YdiL (CAAX protease family)